jgi:hypothetical protein
MVDVPLTGGTFLAEFPGGPDEFVSYAKDGTVLERRLFPQPRGAERPAFKPPHQITRAREVARIQARDGTEEVRLLVADASDGGYCQIVRSEHLPPNRGCSHPRLVENEIGVDAMNYGGAPDGILLLVGQVGAGIASLELEYQDGRRANVPLHRGWALYEIDRRDYAEGRRPTELIGRDRTELQVRSKRMPWAP